MSNGKGLKGQWGVGDPAKAGSDRQSQQFQASFKQQQTAINGHLQFTSANAEAAKHDPLAKRRDELYPAFQGALGKIDRTDPSKAKGDIDTVLGNAKALNTEAAALHTAAQKALNDWKTRQPKFDPAVHQVEEMEAWEYAKAPALRTVVDEIRTKTNERSYAQAVLAVDGMLPKLKPLYEDFQKQKAAKPKYEQVLAEQSARLDALKAAERQTPAMKTKAGEADTALAAAKGKADAKDFVGGMEQMKTAQTAIDAFDKLVKDPQRVKYLADRKAIDEWANKPADVTFPELAADKTAITGLRDQSDPLADSGDYAGANKLLADAKTKIIDYEKKFEKLKQKKDYNDALPALQGQLTEAEKSTYKPLKARLDAITKLKGQMEAAATKEDYAAALKVQKDLKTKVETFLTDLKAMQDAEKEYTAARATLKPKMDDALVSARDFAKVKGTRDKLIKDVAAMEAAEKAQEFVKALEMVKGMGAKIDDFLTKSKVEEDKYKEKGDKLAKQLDDAPDDGTRADVAKAAVKDLKPDEVQHLPTPIRNRLLAEMQKDGLTDDEKKLTKKLFSKNVLDPEFEKLDKDSRKEMIKKMQEDPAFKDARKNWHTMTEAKRLEVLQKAADYQAEAYGIDKTTLADYSKAKGADGSIEYGTYSHSTGKLNINTHDDAMKKGFDEALDTVVHENGHRQQALLIDKLDGKPPPPMDKSDPKYNQATTFKLNDRRSGGMYVRPPSETGAANVDKGPEYFTQPKENHSRITGAAVKRAGIGKEKK
jgi:hypothetical protein